MLEALGPSQNRAQSVNLFLHSPLIKVIGKTRKGKSIEQLQGKLGWTSTQVRNSISRTSA
jgi:hypothetical protein